MGNLRKCKCEIYERVPNVDGVGTHHDKVEKFGLFHEWGKDYEEWENGGTEFSIGIVELADGRVRMVRADAIQFLPSDFTMPGWDWSVYNG